VTVVGEKNIDKKTSIMEACDYFNVKVKKDFLFLKSNIKSLCGGFLLVILRSVGIFILTNFAGFPIMFIQNCLKKIGPKHMDIFKASSIFNDYEYPSY